MKINWHYSEIQLICADLELLVSVLMSKGVELTNIMFVDDLTVRFKVRAVECEKIRKIAEHYQAEYKVIRSYGMAGLKNLFIRRPVLIVGVILFLLLSIFVPRRILFIQVLGNNSLSTQKIIEQANDCGLYFGARRSQIRNEIIKNMLLERLPQLQWVGINTSGCVAIINITERNDQQKEPVTVGPSSIVASKDGVVSSVTVVKGTLACKNGQAVSEGDLLISGYSDCGSALVVSGAQGEVFAETNNEFQILMPRKVLVRTNKSSTEQRLSIILKKNLIKLYKDSGILDSSCVKMYSENYICLPGDFLLPIVFCVEQIERFQTIEIISEEYPAWMFHAGENYMLSRMISGRILNYNSKKIIADHFVGYDLKFTCHEMIGKIKIEEIFGFNGKDDRTNR